jgi:hypothetical protein
MEYGPFFGVLFAACPVGLGLKRYPDRLAHHRIHGFETTKHSQSPPGIDIVSRK